jgi:hypothetical protein
MKSGLLFSSGILFFGLVTFVAASGVAEAAGSTNRQKNTFSFALLGGYDVSGQAALAGGEVAFNLGKRFDLSLGGKYLLAKPETSSSDADLPRPQRVQNL